LRSTSLTVPKRPAAARKELTALNGTLHSISEERLRDAQLLVGELVANAVRHGGRSDAPIKTRVRTNRSVMRVEVTDRGAGFDPWSTCDWAPNPRRVPKPTTNERN
jgi:anti-sigma regulatory factor (Ser/Thr protein kinase)